MTQSLEEIILSCSLDSRLHNTADYITQAYKLGQQSVVDVVEKDNGMLNMKCESCGMWGEHTCIPKILKIK